jgi:hypothetical protein
MVEKWNIPLFHYSVIEVKTYASNSTLNFHSALDSPEDIDYG